MYFQAPLQLMSYLPIWSQDDWALLPSSEELTMRVMDM